MKELLEKIVTFLPIYFLEFGQLLSKPKTFVLSKNQNLDESFVSALIFGAITSVILFIALLQFLAEGELWIKFATYLMLSCVGVCLTAVAMIIGWKAVGWVGASKFVFIVAIYYNMMMSFIAIAFVLFGLGVVRMFVPDYYAILYESVRSGEFIDAAKVRDYLDNYDGSLFFLLTIIGAGGLSLVFGFVFQYIWFFVGWGVFRKLNGFSKLRSGVAFAITLFVNIPATAVYFFIAAAVMNKFE